MRLYDNKCVKDNPMSNKSLIAVLVFLLFGLLAIHIVRETNATVAREEAYKSSGEHDLLTPEERYETMD
jgi:hypothetical protein